MFNRTANLRKVSLAVRTWFVPMVLVIVACIHMNQWRTNHRSSWGAGAGFGMFATVDYHGSRFFRCIVQTDQGQFRLEIPMSVKRDIGLVARAIPSSKNLERVIQEVAKLDWYPSRSNDGYGIATTNSFGDSDIALRVNSIELELWGLQMDADRKRLASYKINQAFLQCQPSNLRNHVAVH